MFYIFTGSQRNSCIHNQPFPIRSPLLLFQSSTGSFHFPAASLGPWRLPMQIVSVFPLRIIGGFLVYHIVDYYKQICDDWTSSTVSKVSEIGFQFHLEIYTFYVNSIGIMRKFPDLDAIFPSYLFFSENGIHDFPGKKHNLRLFCTEFSFQLVYIF